MSNQDSFLLGEIEPEVGERINASWRAAFAKYGELVLIGSAPTLLAMASTEAFAAEGLPQQVVDVLNYALSLEYFEATFYKTANGTEGLIPAKYQGLFGEIGQHENAHVALLSSVLGPAAVKAPKFDFTAGGKYPDVFSNFQTFSTLSSTIEDTGVAAFKGQLEISLVTPSLPPRYRFTRSRHGTPAPSACSLASPARTARSTNQ